MISKITYLFYKYLANYIAQCIRNIRLHYKNTELTSFALVFDDGPGEQPLTGLVCGLHLELSSDEGNTSFVAGCTLLSVLFTLIEFIFFVFAKFGLASCVADVSVSLSSPPGDAVVSVVALSVKEI